MANVLPRGTSPDIIFYRKYKTNPELLRTEEQKLVSKANSNGVTPLMMACSKGHSAVTAWLLDKVRRVL